MGTVRLCTCVVERLLLLCAGDIKWPTPQALQFTFRPVSELVRGKGGMWVREPSSLHTLHICSPPTKVSILLCGGRVDTLVAQLPGAEGCRPVGVGAGDCQEKESHSLVMHPGETGSCGIQIAQTWGGQVPSPDAGVDA